MSVSNGQVANANTFNNAFVSKTETDPSINKITGVPSFQNTTDPDSGNAVLNPQRYMNETADSDGTNGIGDTTRKVYSSNEIVTDGDNRKVAIGKLDAEFNASTGHTHDGSPGSGGQVDAANLDNFNKYYAIPQTFTVSPGVGIDDDVSASFSGKTPGGGVSALGVVTSAPYNRVEIRDASTDTYIEDAGGQRVYGRLTEAASVWTLTYYTNEAGVETSHSLASTNIRCFFLEVYDQETRPTFAADAGYIPSMDITADVIDASSTQSGKVTTGTQSFAGKKTFVGGLAIQSTHEIPKTDVASAATINALTYSPFVKLTGTTATTINGIASGIDGKNIIIHNGTNQVLIISHESASATAANRLKLPNSANITILQDQSVEFIYDTTQSRWIQKSGSGTGSGSGSGARNFILNPDAEASVQGWFAFADAAASTPVDGEGGSPTVTITRTTSSPLRGDGSFLLTKDASNRQGEGVSYGNDPSTFDFEIDLADTNKLMQVSFDFKASVNYAANDIGVWVYDTTNNQLLPMSQNLIPLKGGTFTATFNSTDSLTYRVIIFITSTNASAYTFEFDGVFFGRADGIVLGPVMSEWKNDLTFTPNVAAFTGVTNTNWWYRRVGDSMQVRANWETATANAVVAELALPTGYLLDTSKFSSQTDLQAVGVYYLNRVPTTPYGNSSFLGNMFFDGSASDKLFFAYGGSSNAMLKANGNDVSTTGATTVIEFTIPIQGWGTDVITANSRVFKASDYLAVGTRVTATAPTSLGEYRSYLRVANTQTYTETNGSPTISPTVLDGIALYPGTTYSGGDANNQPSRYEIFVGKNKSASVQFYSSSGRTGHFSPDILIIGSTTVGTNYSYDPTTGIVLVNVFVNGSAPNAGGLGIDELGNPIASQSYFDIIVSDNPLPVQSPISITEWTSYTPTVLGLGTVALIYSDYRLVGQDLQIRLALTTGVPTGVALKVSLPSGYLGNIGFDQVLVGNFGTTYNGADLRGIEPIMLTADNGNIQIGKNQSTSVEAPLNGNIIGGGERVYLNATVQVI